MFEDWSVSMCVTVLVCVCVCVCVKTSSVGGGESAGKFCSMRYTLHGCVTLLFGETRLLASGSFLSIG